MTFRFKLHLNVRLAVTHQIDARFIEVLLLDLRVNHDLVVETLLTV